jgi:hypothetical protein
MQPWFIKEGDVIPFTKKDDKVVKLPNVGAYPNFLTGVDDLQSRVKQGTLSNEMYKKLYTELLHRFMRRESAETPWFLQEFNDMPAGEYEGYELRVRKTGIKPPFVATAEIRKGYEIKGGGQTKEEAIDDVQKKIDDMKSTVATASGTTSLLFNAPFAHEMLKDPSTMDADLYMKIDVVDGKKVLVVGNNSEYTPEQLKAAGFSLSYDRRKQDKRLAGETTAMPMVNVSADTLNAMRLDANGIYQVNTDSPEKDDVGNTVYALQYLGRTSHGTKVRQPRPQFTIGTKTKMESAETPWFLAEAPDELQQIKKLLLKQIGSEQELAVLKKMLSVMRNAGVDDKIAKALKTDADAEPLVQRLVADIMNTEGTVAEKQHFAENYTKGFINLNAILTANQKIPINQILQNEMAPDPNNKDQKQTSFVYAVFEFLATNPPYLKQGIGPGEVALAVLSPSITRVGGGSSAIGDIKVSLGEKDYYVEVKGKNYNAQTKKPGTAGRLVDAKINIADPTGIANALQKVGQKGQRISLTPSAGARVAIPLVGGDNSVVSKLIKAGKDVNAFASEVAGALFSKVPGARAKATQMIAANSEDILNFYTRTLYDRYYKIKSKAEKGKLAGFFFLNMQNKSFFFSTNFDATLDAGSTYDTPVYMTDPKGDANNDPRELAPAIVFK